MRLSLILTVAAAAVALSGCDQLPRIALIYPDKAAPAQCAPAKPVCPTLAEASQAPAAKIPTAPVEPVMAAEAPAPARRHVVRAVARAESHGHVRREATVIAGGPPPAPPYDGQVYVPEPRAYARVDEQETRTEHYAERQESYGYTQGGYVQGGYVQGGYAQGGYVQGGYVQAGPPRGAPCPCRPQPAAGRDRDGFLTWPGKLAQRP